MQNLLALRFANGIFEPIWNRQFVDHVEITVAESIGIEGRASFYEQAGAMRDVFQNHLLQLVALTAMEPPVDFTAESVRNEKVKVLRAMQPPGARSMSSAGSTARATSRGSGSPAIARSPASRRDSTTETFVAAKLYVDNWRWAGTPFYVRVGKRLAKRETTIAIEFKRAPHPPFAQGGVARACSPNVLLVHIQPDEGVSLAIGAKVPGQGMTIRTVHMDFLYGGAFRTELPEAYERLILDCLLGDATLFTRADEVDEQWALVDSDRRRLEARPDVVPQLRRGHVGAGGGRRAPAPGRPGMASALRDTSVGEIEAPARPAARARAAVAADQRGDPHGVGAADEWSSAADARDAWARRPRPVADAAAPPGAGRGRRRLRRDDRARVLPRRRPRRLRRGRPDPAARKRRPKAPASVVVPLQLPDLPVFLRWRGRPPFGRTGCSSS